MSKSHPRCVGVLALVFSLLALAGGCYKDGSSESDGQDARDAPAEGSEIWDDPESPMEVPETGDGGRDPLMCDLVYLPFVTFTFTDAATGATYCGPATIIYEVLDGGETGTAHCDCVDGVMVHDLYGSMQCHINPPVGETSLITVSVEGYEDFVTEVTLPYECHPEAQVDVILVPVDGPSECSPSTVPGCGEGRLCVQTQPPYCTSDYIGFCMSVPEGCDDIPERIVCACDSLTIYRNECEARLEGFGGLLIECP